MICQLRPNRSWSQPHWLSVPPSAVSADQSRSTSSWSLQLTLNETASVNGNCGPPLMAMYSRPASRKNTSATLSPLGVPSRRWTSVTSESSNNET